jgi:hypothetical protein
MPVDTCTSFQTRVIIRVGAIALTHVRRFQGFSSEALAQFQSAADVEHKLEELEDLHQASSCCSARSGRLLRLRELLAQDLADDIGMDVEDLYNYGGNSDFDRGLIYAHADFGDCDSDDDQREWPGLIGYDQRECLDLIGLKRCLSGCTRSLCIQSSWVALPH